MELVAFELLRSGGILEREAFRRFGGLFRRQEEGADGGVGADKRTLCALNAFVGVPDRHTGGNAAVLAGGGTHRHFTVRREGRNRDQVAAAFDAGCVDCADECFKRGIGKCRFRPCRSLRIRPAADFADIDLLERGDSHVNGLDIAAHHVAALMTVGFGQTLLQSGHTLVKRNQAAEIEKHRLHHHVDARAEATDSGNAVGVDIVETQFLFSDSLAHVGGQFFGHTVGSPG